MRTNLFVTSILASGLAFAQSDVIQLRVPAPADSALPRTVFFSPAAESSAGNVEFVRSEFGAAATVKGAPYTAEATTESVQELQDGNRIVHKDTTTVARDSKGRTRRDMTPVLPGLSGADAPKFSFLFDPTTNTSYTLNHTNRTANKSSGHTFNIQISSAVGGESGAKIAGAGPVMGGIVTAGRSATVVHKSEHTEVIEGAPGVAGIRMMRTAEGVDRNSRVEKLGKQNMEGVAVEGTRNVTTIPAGQMGNERPIEIVNERWYSPELQMVVMSKHVDPRQGVTTYRLSNVRREEPAESLFEMPAGYTLETVDIRGPKLRQFSPKE
ncbi:MAG: hypothetical protein SGI92_03455 [Bryobacteraceae bacterium]|nr:hypothetical protein [Bryobacteraceae bacterium]